jgi:hypothetical protein
LDFSFLLLRPTHNRCSETFTSPLNLSLYCLQNLTTGHQVTLQVMTLLEHCSNLVFGPTITLNLRLICNLEFFCQQPRWNIHQRQTPWCVYMTHDAVLACTTYIIVCGSQNPSSETVKARLTANLIGASEVVTSKSHTRDPFFLHCMISHEAFVEAKGIITSLRHRLYDQLDKVDVYAKNTSNRKNLENLTIELHEISQDTDSLLASADMAEMIATRMLTAHSRFEYLLSADNIKDKAVKLGDSLQYLQSSVQSQKRWLLSYKSRKDIAMNLVCIIPALIFPYCGEWPAC